MNFPTNSKCSDVELLITIPTVPKSAFLEKGIYFYACFSFVNTYRDTVNSLTLLPFLENNDTINNRQIK